MGDINIHAIPNAPGGYSLTGKKVMVHDQAAALSASTKMVDATSLAGLSDWWQTVNGNDFIDGASSENNYTLAATDQIKLVFVEGLQFNIVSGAPGNRECQLDLANNKIKFQDLFDGSQTVQVLFNRP